MSRRYVLEQAVGALHLSGETIQDRLSSKGPTEICVPERAEFGVNRPNDGTNKPFMKGGRDSFMTLKAAQLRFHCSEG